MKITKLVIGSSNPGKIKEWKSLLKGKLDILSLEEFGNINEPEESGKTFRENAIIKAKHYSKLTNSYVLSEDGGFEIDYLGGLPGIKSRRILSGDKDGTDEELIEYVLKKLKGVSNKKRRARLSVYVVICDPKGKIIFEDKNSMEGIIADKACLKREEGYPYRSILFLPFLKKFYVELSEKEHKKFAHRKPIAENISKFLLKYK